MEKSVTAVYNGAYVTVTPLNAEEAAAVLMKKGYDAEYAALTILGLMFTTSECMMMQEVSILGTSVSLHTHILYFDPCTGEFIYILVTQSL